MSNAECRMEKVAYAGWANCVRLTNGLVELIATTDVGPRIIRFGFAGGENEFAEFPDQTGRTGGDQWRIYGGHRLWHAPEQDPRTYFPDNSPVAVEDLGGAELRLVQPTEPTTGIAKEIEVRLDPKAAAARVTHRLFNRNPWAVQLAPWALSVMAPGGVAIVPLPPPGEHRQNLTPATSLALWAYTDMSDLRWTWGRRFILLRQDPSRAAPQKLGAMVAEGWVAYARAGRLFVKAFMTCASGGYPDLGCSVEVFADGRMLEVETLGPLTTLAPGACTEHVEHWLLFDGVPTPNNDADVERHVLPKVRPAGG